MTKKHQTSAVILLEYYLFIESIEFYYNNTNSEK
jgi:hypothetical protein